MMGQRSSLKPTPELKQQETLYRLGDGLMQLSARLYHCGRTLSECDLTAWADLEEIITEAQGTSGQLSTLTGSPFTPQAVRELEAHVG